MDNNRIRAAVCGAAGRMGREVVKAVAGAPDVELVAAIDRARVGEDAGAVAGAGVLGVLITADLPLALADSRASVIVDFTTPDAVLKNARDAVALGASPVIGTTGLAPAELDALDSLAKAEGVPVFVAPNFAIGAVLMMEFAAKAARFMPDVEIIELHHEKKLDAPSGTALLTAKKVAAARAEAGVTPAHYPSEAVEKATGARGAHGEATHGITIHSVRLPGYVAHQEVLFGGLGQILSLRHDSLDRASFMPGVLLAIRNVRRLSPGVTVGLESLLDA